MGGKKIRFELFLTPVSTGYKVNNNHTTQPGRGKGNIMNIGTKIDPENLLLLTRLQRGSSVIMTKHYDEGEVCHLFVQLRVPVRVTGKTVERPERMFCEDVVNTVAIASKFKYPVNMQCPSILYENNIIQEMIDDQHELYPHLKQKGLILSYDGIFVSVMKGVKK